MIRVLASFFQEQQRRVMDALQSRVPASRKAVTLPDSFWNDEEAMLFEIMLSFLQRGAEGGVAVHQGLVESLGIGIDWTQSYTAAADWARKYGGKLVRGITRTTRDRIGVQVGNWIEQPGATLGDLWHTLASDHAFSPARAKLIAITETTAAYARGETHTARELERAGYFEYEKEWQTNNDDIVCPVCQSLHGTRVQGTHGMFPIGVQAPPAHPGCRCWVNTIPRVPGMEKT